MPLKSIIQSTPLPKTKFNTRSIFKWSILSLNSEFSFSETGCHTSVKELSQTYYLFIAVRRVGFMPFSRESV